MSDAAVNAAIDYIQNSRERAREELLELLRIPSISTLAEHTKDIRRAAEWIADYTRRIGLEHVEVMETDGHPVVYADWLHAEDAPTVLIYGHYDVQPTDPEAEWDFPPFKPTLRGTAIYARGSSDNKGQFFAQLKALEAWLQTAGRLPLNVKLCIEGEEEIGSRHLPALLEDYRERFSAELCVISDSPMRGPGRPLILYGLRGTVYGEIEVSGPSRDLHSGNFGGAVHNPLQALCEILAALHDDRGRVALPGFYDAVRSLSELERRELAEAGMNEKELIREAGVPAVWGEEGYRISERLGARPTLEIHGIRGGFTGEGIKTVIPARATAKVSMRLVPYQDADAMAELLEQHVQRLAPKTVRVSANMFFRANPILVERDHPLMEAASRAYETGFGARPEFALEGGSIPIVSTLQDIYDIPVLLMGFGLPDDRPHAPNEKLDLRQFEGGIACAVSFLQEAAAGGAAARTE
jgi:acetylornithine deacetylase/succinyl-diaminopimelate desuccinylase-like protein